MRLSIHWIHDKKVSSQLEDALQHRSLLYSQHGMRDMKSIHQRKGVIFPNLKDHGKLSKDALEIVIALHTKKIDSTHANALTQRPNEEKVDVSKNGQVVKQATTPTQNLDLNALASNISDQLSKKLNK